MTDIVPVPAAPSVPMYPALGSLNFNAEAYAYGTAMPGVVTAIRAMADAAHTNATAAQEQAQASALERLNAIAATTAIKDATRDYRDAAAISALAAQGAANFRGKWSALVGAIAMPATVLHSGKFWALLQPLADITAAEPGVSAAWASTTAAAPHIAYDDRATLRSTPGAPGDQALVGGLGLFVFYEGTDEPDDDESCFATGAGQWLLQCPNWDLLSSWQMPDDDARDWYLLRGTALCAITFVGGQLSASFIGTVIGAIPGDSVIATPPAQLGRDLQDSGRLAYHAYVSALDTVTVTLTAAHSSATTNPAIQTAWPITVIKGVQS